MERLLTGLVLLIFLITGGVSCRDSSVPASPDSTVLRETGDTITQNTGLTRQEDPELSASTPGSNVWATGKLVPVTWATLRPAQGGLVQTIHVREGDWVEKGDLLIELENGVLSSEVMMASASLGEAEAAYTKLLAEANAADVATAEASLAAAQAEVAQAEGRLQEVQAAVAIAQARLQIVEQEYNELESGPTEVERAAAAAEVDIAQAAATQAQAVYNTVQGDPNIGMRPESLLLQQATEALEAAQAQYAVATQGATPQQLAVAAARIEEARSAVAAAQSQIPMAEAGVDAAKARVVAAQAALDKLLAGASKEDLAISQARVRAAKAALLRARMELQQTKVIAPFAGQVGSIHANTGELAAHDEPLILLGDTRKMQVETIDLSEMDVAQVVEGMTVEVSFDALPDRTFRGTIDRIALISISNEDDTSYTVTIEVPELDERLRWGMTAFVDIQTQ